MSIFSGWSSPFLNYSLFTLFSYKTCNQPKPAKITKKYQQLAKTTHNSLNCLKWTKGTHHPNSPQTRSISKVLHWSMKVKHLFPGIFEANFRMFIHTGYQKHWVWELYYIHSEFFLGIFCTTETSHCNPNLPKKLKYLSKFKLGLNKARTFYNYIINIIWYSTMFSIFFFFLLMTSPI